MGGKEFLNLVTVLTLHIDPQNLKIPIIGVSQKVTIDDEGGRGCLETVWKRVAFLYLIQRRHTPS